MLTLLHTSPVHVAAFDALRDAEHPGVVLRHLVHEELLARARAEGPGAVVAEVGAVLARAVDEGATAVLCTCSTIGDIAERAAPALGVPVLRVDRPMAGVAAAAGRVVVVATVASTLGPTADLVRDEAARQRREPGPLLSTVFVEGAWELFEAGDQDGYLAAVAAAVDRIPPPAVVVLAQASMAAAAARVTGEVTVLAAPRTGLAAAVRATRDPARGGARSGGHWERTAPVRRAGRSGPAPRTPGGEE
ncbi:arylsulfatase [Streptomyces paludis]|uniref:arylsulfatase n=1 Tax=Streptomyces paludis TaxID=2282738 RepID=UPI001E3995ED|nr:arylsulfatase [Streptomyces paludis]